MGLLTYVVLQKLWEQEHRSRGKKTDPKPEEKKSYSPKHEELSFRKCILEEMAKSEDTFLLDFFEMIEHEYIKDFRKRMQPQYDELDRLIVDFENSAPNFLEFIEEMKKVGVKINFDLKHKNHTDQKLSGEFVELIPINLMIKYVSGEHFLDIALPTNLSTKEKRLAEIESEIEDLNMRITKLEKQIKYLPFKKEERKQLLNDIKRELKRKENDKEHLENEIKKVKAILGMNEHQRELFLKGFEELQESARIIRKLTPLRSQISVTEHQNIPHDSISIIEPELMAHMLDRLETEGKITQDTIAKVSLYLDKIVEKMQTEKKWEYQHLYPIPKQWLSPVIEWFVDNLYQTESKKMIRRR